MVKQQQGFTLIELMIASMIMAILAAIAVPSYERYRVSSAEDKVKAQMGQLELQLEAWRAKTLSYRGFEPIKGKTAAGVVEYGYDIRPISTTNTVLYVPLGSNESNFEYLLEVVDADSHKEQDANGNRLTDARTLSLVPTADGINTALGRGYRIVAYPSTKLGNKGARKFALGSDGYRCAVRKPNFNNINVGTTVCTGVGTETW